jgi:membrane protein
MRENTGMKQCLKFLLIVAALFAASGAVLAEALSSRSGQENGRRRPSTADGDIDSPLDLPKHKWKQALLRTKQALKDKDLAASAAGLAYYATLTFFPALLGLASCYAYFADPHSLLNALSQLQHILPAAIYELLQKQLAPLASGSRHGLGVAALVSIIALLWTTSGGMQNLVKATNKAYEVKESRKFFKLRLTSVALSVVLLVIGGLILGLLLMQGTALEQLGAPHWMASLFPILRWPVLVILVSVILSAVYRYAPDRREPHWQWVSWGAAAATIIWLAATAVFFIYVQNFGSYTKTYGAFAGLIVLMVWFNVSSLIVLLGAQVNKKLEEVTPASARQ